MERVVVAGTGQFTNRAKELKDVLEPLRLMEHAFKAMEDEVGNRAPSELDLLAVVNIIAWDYGNVPKLLKERLKISAKQALYTTISGHSPQWLLCEIARRIQNGELDSAVIIGAEAMNAVAFPTRRASPFPGKGHPKRSPFLEIRGRL